MASESQVVGMHVVYQQHLIPRDEVNYPKQLEQVGYFLDNVRRKIFEEEGLEFVAEIHTYDQGGYYEFPEIPDIPSPGRKYSSDRRFSKREAFLKAPESASEDLINRIKSEFSTELEKFFFISRDRGNEFQFL
jgi:hypothetical protein